MTIKIYVSGGRLQDKFNDAINTIHDSAKFGIAVKVVIYTLTGKKIPIAESYFDAGEKNPGNKNEELIIWYNKKALTDFGINI